MIRYIMFTLFIQVSGQTEPDRYARNLYFSEGVCLGHILDTDDEGNYVLPIWHTSRRLKYLIVQKERCPKTNKLHWQGYLELSVGLPEATWMDECKQLFFENYKDVHLSIRKRSRANCRDYCRKPESRVVAGWEYGVWDERDGGTTSVRGKRSDLDELGVAILTGQLATRRAIAEANPGAFIRYGAGIERLLTTIEASPRERKAIACTILIGEPGTGKSCRMPTGDDVFYMSSESLFNGCTPMHRVLVLDEFTGWLPFNVLLRILDHYPYRVNIKYNNFWAGWDEVYITSNSHPDQWYTYDAKHLYGALERRITRFFTTTTTAGAPLSHQVSCLRTGDIHEWIIPHLADAGDGGGEPVPEVPAAVEPVPVPAPMNQEDYFGNLWDYDAALI